MTSQKRYRHHQENNAQRFRDLPPRFKRQKSLTSQNNSTSSPSPAASPTLPRQTSPASLTPPASPPAFTTMTKRSDPGRVHQGHKSATSNSNAQSQSRVVTSPKPKAVLSQVDNRNSTSPPSMIDTGYPMAPNKMLVSYGECQVPVSSWPVVNPSYNPAFMSNPWAPISVDMYAEQRVHTPPFVVYNENYAPVAHSGPASPWSQPSYSPYQSAAPSPSPSIQSSVASADVIPPTATSPSSTDTEQSTPDMSDPDIRTIEMLRELERVADQKETEAEEFGSDRKTLVSHHLRMLMCAVDRYTEGIDGEDDETKEESRSDEVFASSPVSSTSPSPAPPKPAQKAANKDPANKKAKPQTRGPVPAATNWRSPQVSTCPTMPSNPPAVPMTQPTFAPSVWSSTPAAPKPPLQPLMRAKPTFDNSTPSPMTPRTPEWNLWSSPGFDFFGVYNR